MMGDKLVVILMLVVSMVALTTPVVAQEQAPEVLLLSADIEIAAGGVSTVTAEYEFEVESTGSGDVELTAIEGTMWKIADRSLGDVVASVDGESVDETIEEASEHYVVSIPVEEVEDGDTVTVQLVYEVSGPEGELQAPLWAPEYPTTGETAVVHTAVTFPDGTFPQGDSFPDPNSVEENLATYDTLHVPGFIKVSYDDSPSGLLTMNALYSTLGVLIVLVLVIGGLLIDRKTGQEA